VTADTHNKEDLMCRPFQNDLAMGLSCE